MRLAKRLLVLVGLLAIPVLLALAGEQLAARPGAPTAPNGGHVRIDGVTGATATASPTSIPAPVVPTQITRSAAPAPADDDNEDDR